MTAAQRTKEMAQDEVEAFMDGEAVRFVAGFVGREGAQRVAARALIRIAGNVLAMLPGAGPQAAGDYMSELGAQHRQTAARRTPIARGR